MQGAGDEVHKLLEMQMSWGESERWAEEEEERDPEGLTAVSAHLRVCWG